MKLFKSKREKILQRMELPKEIRKLDSKEQEKIIVDFINKLFESKILEDKRYIKNVPNYVYSKRQKRVLENFVSDLEQDSIIDAYWELWDFVDNYEDKTYKKLLLIEAQEVIKNLQLICDKINNRK